jgi:pimeloyl-ACP methyl ester carboxylesterase
VNFEVNSQYAAVLVIAGDVCRVLMVEDKTLSQNREIGHKRRTPLPMPVLLLWGDSDPFLLPNLLHKIGAVSPFATVRILPKCSHWIQQDAPDEVNAMLHSFVMGSACPPG